MVRAAGKAATPGPERNLNPAKGRNLGVKERAGHTRCGVAGAVAGLPWGAVFFAQVLATGLLTKPPGALAPLTLGLLRQGEGGKLGTGLIPARKEAFG
jgi:hypothetical protein